MKEWEHAADGAGRVRVDGHWTVPGVHREWTQQATLVSSATGDWSLGSGNHGMLGWAAGELRTVGTRDIVHPDDQEFLEQRVRFVPRAHFVPVELRLLARDSRYWWTRWHLVTTAKTTVDARGVEVLRPASELGPPVGTWHWDVDRDEVGWSAELLDMFSQVRAPASMAACLALVDEDDRDALADRLRRTADDDAPFRLTFRCSTTGLHDRWFHAAGRKLLLRDGSRRVAGVVKYLNPPSTWPRAKTAIGCG